MRKHHNIEEMDEEEEYDEEEDVREKTSRQSQ